MIKRNDVQIILPILLIAFSMLSVISYSQTRAHHMQSEEQSYVMIYSGNHLFTRVSLEEPQTIVVESNKGRNEVEISSDGVAMHSSTCDDQICLHQGKVTPDNMSGRMLGAWIMCLPNEVTIELVKGE